MDAKETSGRKLRNYYPKFSSQESADTFKDFSSIFNGEKFKVHTTQLEQEPRPDAPQDPIHETLKELVQAADLKVQVAKCKNGQDQFVFGGRRISTFVKNGAVCVRMKQDYMSAEDFVCKYGKLEEMREMRKEESKRMVENITVIGSHGKSKFPEMTSVETMRYST